MSNETKSKDFLRTIIDEDLANKKYNSIITRFPPEPNGFLHIGHAKSICLNFGIARDYNGKCHLRFDDTDPTKEDFLYVNSIQEDIKWLGFDWGENMFFASDYFENLYNYAVQLIKMDKAYVCSLNEEEIREYRGTVKELGRHSPYRNRTIEENLDMFARMRNGYYKDGEHVLRAKIDMASANMKMRDPLLYRIRHENHYRKGYTWCIYPMYDFAHCLSDYMEGISHSICTLEFENNRELYDWILDELELKTPRPYQHEFARLNLTYTMMSKRRLLQLVEEKHVDGWDDPRMSTISGYRRRGYTAESIKKFCENIGIAKANSTVDIAQLEFCIRDDLNPKVPRVMAVLKPLKVIIENYPEDQVEMIDASYYPHDVPKEGSRKVPFAKELYIEQTDFMENPPKDFYRLSPGQEVRLRHAYFIKCEKVIKDECGNIKELRCTYDPESKGSDRKVKGTIHWVAASHAKQVEVRLYDRLFTVESPSDLEFLNANSLEVITNAFVEPAVINERPDERFQFERHGYFYIDPVNSKEGKFVFNRIVSLKDSWAKKKKEQPKQESQKQTIEQPQQKSEPIVLTGEAEQIFNEYQSKYALNDEVATILAKDSKLSECFNNILAIYNKPTVVANFVANELSRELKDKNVTDLKFELKELAQLIELIDKETISWKIAKNVFEDMIKQGGNPQTIVENKGLIQISDPAQLEPIIDEIIANNPKNVKLYKEGKTTLLGFFIGQTIKATRGKANPKVVNEIVLKKLS